MLMGREVGYNIEAFFFAEDTFEDWVCKVERIATELIRNEEKGKNLDQKM